MPDSVDSPAPDSTTTLPSPTRSATTSTASVLEPTSASRLVTSPVSGHQLETTMALFGKEHVQKYQETDGEEGHDWRGTTTLLLTTTGRKSGEKRTTPLIYQVYRD